MFSSHRFSEGSRFLETEMNKVKGVARRGTTSVFFSLCFFLESRSRQPLPPSKENKGEGNVASVLCLNFISCDVTFVVFFEASIYLHHQSSEILSPLRALTRRLNVSVHLLRSTSFASLEGAKER